MSKRWIWWRALVFCFGIAGWALAESAEWDAEAVRSMSREERLAYQQAYKAELEKVARERGWVPGKKRAFESAGRQARPPQKFFGTIAYDSGIFGVCCRTNRTIGNQFDTALNPAGTAISPVSMSGSISAISFHMIHVGGGAVFLSLYDNVTGTMADLITSISVPAAPGSNYVRFPIPIPYSGSSFLAGIWQFTPTSDTLAVATGTLGGQGFHGMSINAIVGTGFTTLASLNAAVRTHGDIVTPVELLNFEVE